MELLLTNFKIFGEEPYREVSMVFKPSDKGSSLKAVKLVLPIGEAIALMEQGTRFTYENLKSFS